MKLEEVGEARDGPKERMTHLGCHPEEFRRHLVGSRGLESGKMGGQESGSDASVRVTGCGSLGCSSGVEKGNRSKSGEGCRVGGTECRWLWRTRGKE